MHSALSLFWKQFSFYIFIFGRAESLLLHRLFSSCGEWGLLSGYRVRASHFSGFCWAQALGSRLRWFRRMGSGALTPRLQHTGLAAPWHVGFSQVRDECMSPAWSDGFFTTEPRGKPQCSFFWCESLCSFHRLTFPTCGNRRINTSLFTVAFQADLDPFISDDKVQRRGGNISENKLSLMKCKKQYSCGQTWRQM